MAIFNSYVSLPEGRNWDVEAKIDHKWQKDQQARLWCSIETLESEAQFSPLKAVYFIEAVHFKEEAIIS
jgi:hypothetical protein